MNPIAAQRVSVTTADGLALATRQIGPEAADLTVILLHGLLGDRDSWRCQTSHLTSRHPDIRVIAYDQRGHGRSGRGCALGNTLGQLARDLDAVIDTTTPTGHIVLVGHSMGAMTILQYLQHHQSRNKHRITGVGLIATAAADITRHGLGRLLASPLAGGACALAAHIPASVGSAPHQRSPRHETNMATRHKEGAHPGCPHQRAAAADPGGFPRLDLSLRRHSSLPNPQPHTDTRHVRNRGLGHAASPFGGHCRRGLCSGARRCPRRGTHVDARPPRRRQRQTRRSAGTSPKGIGTGDHPPRQHEPSLQPPRGH